ncbi:unnamed protein product [Leptosia nina]|uniref:Uncharacterized protein n=1 Tax=Leptosia nina TaxID=320188 RepID=A0AAV1J5K0_9NEOP
MQMYYAYPVPSPKVNSNFDDTGTSGYDYRNQNGERTSNNRATDTESLTNVKLLNSKAEAENTPVNVAMKNAGNTGYSNAISTAGVSEGSGYNYNAGQPSKDSGISPSSTGPVANVGVTVSDPTGYNYEGQNMVSSQATLNTGYSTPASVENYSGYNYERQNTAQVINYNVNTETQTPTIPSTNSGYAYENQNNAKVRENKDTANIGPLNNKNPGYNYPTGKGTTQTSQIKANASFGTNPTEILSKTGYNYERRILMNSNSETDFEPTYSSGSNNKNDDLTSINSQRQSQGPKYNSQSLPSTNYLPTSENVYKLPESYLPVKPTSKVQTSRPIPQSTVTRAPLKKSYLTPNTMDIPKESTTHMTSGDIQNIQTTNEYIPPPMLEPIPKPSLQYLTPNKNQKK